MLTIIQTISYELIICLICYFIVLVSISVDLASGWRKAKKRKEARTSTALSRTITKFILYEGSMTIASGIDVMVRLTHFFELLKINLLVDVPIITIAVGIFLCFVEIKSVREKADEKTKKQMLSTEELIREIVSLVANNRINPRDIASAIIENLENNNTKKTI